MYVFRKKAHRDGFKLVTRLHVNPDGVKKVTGGFGTEDRLPIVGNESKEVGSPGLINSTIFWHGWLDCIPRKWIVLNYLVVGSPLKDTGAGKRSHPIFIPLDVDWVKLCDGGIKAEKNGQAKEPSLEFTAIL
jgi:hypothetical protein